MCRITIATMTNYNSREKSLLFDQLMSLGAGDDWQKDGWGLTDGNAVFKDHGSYNNPERSYTWTIRLDPKKSWIGHVRAASLKTGLTRSEAHPYSFGRFLGVHNGTMVPGSKKFTYPEGPKTDSWQALCLLDHILREELSRDKQTFSSGREEWFLRHNILGYWLSHFMKASTFVFSLMFNNGDILALRGDGERELWWKRVGNGLLLHTKNDHITSVSRWDTIFKMGLHLGTDAAIEFPKNSWCLLRPGSQTIDIHPLEYSLEAPLVKSKKKKVK